jgi:hypothetical protein
MNNFSDPIHINITVDAVSGTSVFGESTCPYISSNGYSKMRAKVVADAKTSDDSIAIGAAGSMTAADPTGGTGSWDASRAEAKALGLIPDDGKNDGTTTFGAGYLFTFSGPIAAGTYDFEGVCAHEISEVMGRVGLKGFGIYTLLDDFGYTGAGTKGLAGGPGNYFSIDNGTTSLMEYNDWTSNNFDSRDWYGGTIDSFNQYATADVVNPVSNVDLRELDVIGYDRVAVPEPSAVALLSVGVIGLLSCRWRRNRHASSSETRTSAA